MTRTRPSAGTSTSTPSDWGWLATAVTIRVRVLKPSFSSVRVRLPGISSSVRRRGADGDPVRQHRGPGRHARHGDRRPSRAQLHLQRLAGAAARDVQRAFPGLEARRQHRDPVDAGRDLQARQRRASGRLAVDADLGHHRRLRDDLHEAGQPREAQAIVLARLAADLDVERARRVALGRGRHGVAARAQQEATTELEVGRAPDVDAAPGGSVAISTARRREQPERGASQEQQRAGDGARCATGRRAGQRRPATGRTVAPGRRRPGAGRGLQSPAPAAACRSPRR